MSLFYALQKIFSFNILSPLQDKCYCYPHFSNADCQTDLPESRMASELWGEYLYSGSLELQGWLLTTMFYYHGCAKAESKEVDLRTGSQPYRNNSRNCLPSTGFAASVSLHLQRGRESKVNHPFHLSLDAISSLLLYFSSV